MFSLTKDCSRCFFRENMTFYSKFIRNRLNIMKKTLNQNILTYLDFTQYHGNCVWTLLKNTLCEWLNLPVVWGILANRADWVLHAIKLMISMNKHLEQYNCYLNNVVNIFVPTTTNESLASLQQPQWSSHLAAICHHTWLWNYIQYYTYCY